MIFDKEDVLHYAGTRPVGKGNMEAIRILLIRHASPDWNRKDIPYDIPPGPPLTARGEKEAEQLAGFLKSKRIVKLYYSPFERALKTASIICELNQIPGVEELRLTEWRGNHEPEQEVKARMKAVFEAAYQESQSSGPIGLVSHGGPIDLLLQELGIDRNELAIYKTKFDTINPLPPAGAWEAERDEQSSIWRLRLTFIPSAN